MISRIKQAFSTDPSQLLQCQQPVSKLSPAQKKRIQWLKQEMEVQSDNEDPESDEEHPQYNFLSQVQPIDCEWLQDELKQIEEQSWLGSINYTHLFERQLISQVRTLQDIKQQVQEKFGTVDIKFLNSAKTATSSLSFEKYEYNLVNQKGQKIRIILNQQQFLKLLPNNDLNDTIIDNYLKIVNHFLIHPDLNGKVYFFSTFLLSKLLKEILQNEKMIDQSSEWRQFAIESVKQNYSSVKRWTRRQDIFQKQVLIFPINMLKHWFCIIVTNPGALLEPGSIKQCQIAFCDSMFQKRMFVVDAIRQYLEMQLQDKKNINYKVTEFNAPDYQLLLPRQTNTHDCGLYMLIYIQELLIQKQTQLEDLKQIEKRIKLDLAPRIYFQSSRQRVMRLLVELFEDQTPSSTKNIIDNYLRERMNHKEIETDNQFLNFQQYQKYEALFLLNKEKTVDQLNQEKFSLLIRFYYGADINFYSKEEYFKPQEDQSSDFI